jgi:predicted metal-dependent hydrolase
MIDDDILSLNGKITALAELQAISLGIRMKTIDKDPYAIKRALKKAQKRKLSSKHTQSGYDYIINIALSNAPEDMMEY